MMKIIARLREFKALIELEKHYKDHHGQIKYTNYKEIGTDNILKQDFACVCGKKWSLDYGLSKMEKRGEIKRTETIHLDWRPGRERDSGQ